MKGNRLVIAMVATLGSFGATAELLSQEVISASPLSLVQLDNYRGGFKLPNNYVVNIGLSVSTSINGRMTFSNQIANLVIENGKLRTLPTSSTSNTPSSVVNVTQVGNGNHVAGIGDAVTDSNGTSPVEQLGSSNLPKQIAEAAIMPSVSHLTPSNFASLTNIVQNSLDNSVIGMNTIVNIDAQVSQIMQSAKHQVQLNNAILMSAIP